MAEDLLVRTERHAGHVEAVLVGGRGNALSPAGLAELEQSLRALVAEGAPPLLLRSAGSSFCTGLDLDVARALDRAGMRGFMEAFHRGLAAMAAYPGPAVAAIGGHALAGGALLALSCDLRIMARGRARFGVHGVQLGVSYPDVAIEIARYQLGARRAADLLYEGTLRGADEALGAGWIDAVEEEDRLLIAALDALRRCVTRSKPELRRPLNATLARIDARGMDAWLDQWFSVDTQSRLAARTASPIAPRGGS